METGEDQSSGTDTANKPGSPKKKKPQAMEGGRNDVVSCEDRVVF